uniref:PDZ domain-containing protein n=1 Tax=Pyrodinium bahamense TaxID=73915 RepID=A0A7S0F9G0_9DINO
METAQLCNWHSYSFGAQAAAEQHIPRRPGGRGEHLVRPSWSTSGSVLPQVTTPHIPMQPVSDSHQAAQATSGCGGMPQQLPQCSDQPSQGGLLADAAAMPFSVPAASMPTQQSCNSIAAVAPAPAPPMSAPDTAYLASDWAASASGGAPQESAAAEQHVAVYIYARDTDELITSFWGLNSWTIAQVKEETAKKTENALPKELQFLSMSSGCYLREADILGGIPEFIRAGRSVMFCTRVRYFCVDLERGTPEAKLGISVTQEHGQGMKVAKIDTSGLAADWNNRCHATFPDRVLQTGDVILRVNGLDLACGQSNEQGFRAMLEQLHKARELLLVTCRQIA